jgi:hypothetical protein
VATSASSPGAGGSGQPSGPPAGPARIHGPAARAVVKTLPAKPLSYLGVYEDGVPDSFGAVDEFESSVGVVPNIALYYSSPRGPAAAMAGAWYPGQGYVTWMGIDGYYANRGDSFESVFDTVLSVVQGFGKPVIISETAVGPATGNQVAGIHNLFARLRTSRLLGLIWFDMAQDSGQYHQDWRLEGDPALIRAFRAAAGYISS